MSEKTKYAPRKIPGLFAVIVLLVLAAGAYGAYLIAPTVSAFASPTSAKAKTSAQTVERNVTVADLKVARISAKTAAAAEKKNGPDPDQYGQITQGATTAAREAAHITWSSETKCVSGDTPTYKVQVMHTQLSSDEVAADYTPRTLTTTGKSLYVGHIQNGLTYDIKVSGACNPDGQYGAVVSGQFLQKLPQSNGVTVSSHGGKYSLFFGHVSTSPDVRYEFQYSNAGGAWQPFKDATGDIGFTRGPAGFYMGSGTQFRVRGYTMDQSSVGAWSVGRSGKVSSSGYSSGYSNGYGNGYGNGYSNGYGNGNSYGGYNGGY